MRKTTLILLGAVLAVVIGLASVLVYNNREKRYPKATISTLNEVEGNWYLANVQSYYLVVEITFSEERRLHKVTVVDNQIAEASLAYWDRESRDWGTPIPIGPEEAAWYTVPGLFDTIRGALQNGSRDYVRADLRGDPPLPYTIVLGPTVIDGQLMDDTVTWVTVREFTPSVNAP